MRIVLSALLFLSPLLVFAAALEHLPVVFVVLGLGFKCPSYCMIITFFIYSFSMQKSPKWALVPSFASIVQSSLVKTSPWRSSDDLY